MGRIWLAWSGDHSKGVLEDEVNAVTSAVGRGAVNLAKKAVGIPTDKNRRGR